MKEFAVSKEIRVRAKMMATSSAVKIVTAWGRDQKASYDGKTAEHPTHHYRLGCILECSIVELRSYYGW